MESGERSGAVKCRAENRRVEPFSGEAGRRERRGMEHMQKCEKRRLGKTGTEEKDGELS